MKRYFPTVAKHAAIPCLRTSDGECSLLAFFSFEKNRGSSVKIPPIGRDANPYAVKHDDVC